MSVKAQLAILFADIGESTRLYLGLGDAQASLVISQCIAAMTKVVSQSGGRVIRVIGDEVLAVFAKAEAAVAAATGMQDAIAVLPPVLGRRLGIRVGMHFGEVLIESAELYGNAVNLAARMVTQAKAGEILVTGATVAGLAGPCQSICRHIGWIDIKGHDEAVEICEIVWRAEEATIMAVSPANLAVPPRSAAPRMAFSRNDTRLFLSDRKSVLTFGRDEQNDIVVMGGKVSRRHGFVEIRNRRVFLVDQSANGTLILPDFAPPSLLHRDSMVLSGAGLLGLGEQPDLNPLAAIRYAAAPSSGGD